MISSYNDREFKLSRRAALLGGSAMLLAGCTTHSNGSDFTQGRTSCRSPESLAEFSRIGGARVWYVPSEQPMRLQSDPLFIKLLDRWAADWVKLSGLGKITRIWSYGAYVDKCNSFHAAGRAFDIAKIEQQRGKISCRYDQWQPGSAQQLRNYWRLAASLHLHFAYTLSYRYDQAHHNHIHFDNGISEAGLSTFNPESQVQVEMVQAAARYVFNIETELTGAWDDATKASLRQMQNRLGISQPVANPEGWHRLLRGIAAAS